MENYHKHCSESNIFTPDSAARYEEYAQRAVDLGDHILSTVEHGWQGRYHLAYEIAKKHKLKLIFGTEAYWVKDNQEKDRSNNHIILLAKNENGRRKINKILSDANEFGYYYKPRIDEKSILELPGDDVFVTSACIAFWNYDDDYNEQFVKKLSEHFKENFMLEVQYHNSNFQKELNEKILKLSKKYNIQLIAGMDSHYIDERQKKERDFILESKKVKYDYEESFYMDYPDNATIIERFKEQGILNVNDIKQAMENTEITMTFEDFTKNNRVFSKERKIPTLYDGKHYIDGKLQPELSQTERDKVYTRLITKKYREYTKDFDEKKKKKYHEGIQSEVNVVKETGMSDYFLIDYEIVREAVKNGGILTNSGRGSSVGFFTNTLLGFSKVDRFQSPIKLYPERFMSKSRIIESNSLPDIDLNWGTQEIAETAQRSIMGKNHAYPMIAFGTYKKKAAFKLYARAKDLDFDIANEISKQIEKYDEAVKYADDDDERDEINIYDYVDEKYHSYVTQSKPYWGIISDKKKAPCSYLLYDGDIREEIGLIKCKSESTKKEAMTTVIDGSVAENYKFLKNDLLKVNTVLLTDMIYKRLNMVPHTVEELKKAVENDDKVWDLYAKGLTIGVNQCEKESTIEKLKHYKPRNISELSAFIAAIRPGFRSMYSKFASREKYEYGIKPFDNLIQTEQFPYSYIMYQEQLMSTFNYVGFPIDECYTIIKDIAKKHPEKIRSLRNTFIENFSEKIKNDIINDEEPVEVSKKIWQIIDDSTAYIFNSAHAYCMAIDSLYNAWQKAHYPYVFYEQELNFYSDTGKKDKVIELKKEMLNGFNIKESDYRWGKDHRKFVQNPSEHEINPSLVSIKGLSNRVARILYKTYKKFSKVDSFCELYPILKKAGCDSGHLNILINLNYFEQFGTPYKLHKYCELVDEIGGRSQFNKNAENTLKHIDLIKRFAKKETEKQYREFDSEEALKWAYDRIEDKTPSYKEQISNEFKYLGYIKTLNKSIPPEFVIVQIIDGKYKNKIVSFQRLCDGSVVKYKVKGAKLTKTPLMEGQIIKIEKVTDEHKWTKDSTGWHQVEETEKILKEWNETT